MPRNGRNRYARSLTADARRKNQFCSADPAEQRYSLERRLFNGHQQDNLRVNGAVFEVNRILGPGFLEKVYENALLVELKRRGLRAESRVPIKVLYKQSVVGDYIADIVVENRVIIELKSVEALDRIHEAQVLNYLKATGMKVALLVNFRNPKVQIKRLFFDLPENQEGR